MYADWQLMRDKKLLMGGIYFKQFFPCNITIIFLVTSCEHEELIYIAHDISQHFSYICLIKNSKYKYKLSC